MGKPRLIGDIISDMFKTPHKEKYHKYLNSIDWKSKKTRVMQKRGGRCERCNSSYRIEVHHKTYERIFNERLDDLEVLCFQCHRKEHNG